MIPDKAIAVPQIDWVNLAIGVFALYMLGRSLPRAIAFLMPRAIRISGEPGGLPGSPKLQRMGEAIEALGFRHLGARRELLPLRGELMRSDVYVSISKDAWADIFPFKNGEPFLYFLSTFEDGAVVLTADHQWHFVEGDSVQAGALPGGSPEQVLAAHKVTLERFAERHGQPHTPDDLSARLAAARSWYRGPGSAGLRRLFIIHFLNVCVASVLLAFSVTVVFKGLK